MSIKKEPQNNVFATRMIYIVIHNNYIIFNCRKEPFSYKNTLRIFPRVLISVQANMPFSSAHNIARLMMIARKIPNPKDTAFIAIMNDKTTSIIKSATNAVLVLRLLASKYKPAKSIIITITIFKLFITPPYKGMKGRLFALFSLPGVCFNMLRYCQHRNAKQYNSKKEQRIHLFLLLYIIFFGIILISIM